MNSILYRVIFIMSMFATLAKGQKAIPEHIVNLSAEINETSGLIHHDGDFWTINDSGGAPHLYRFSKIGGHIIQTIKIDNAKNIDWEDISQDDYFIYIGDTGNNRGSRNKFTIYKIAKKDIPKGLRNATLSAHVITFSYEDQPPSLKAYDHDFDCEALININGQIGLLTKNWASGNSNYYLIDEESQTAKKQASFNTSGLVCGADYISNKDQLIIIGYQSINREFLPFFIQINKFSVPEKRSVQRYQLTSLNGFQTEGICWDGKTIIISNEQTKLAPQSIHKITFSH